VITVVIYPKEVTAAIKIVTKTTKKDAKNSAALSEINFEVFSALINCSSGDSWKL